MKDHNINMPILERGWVKVGACFEEYINQKIRDCIIVKVTKTRFRMEYELPKSGVVGAWRPHDNFCYVPDLS